MTDLDRRIRLHELRIARAWPPRYAGRRHRRPRRWRTPVIGHGLPAAFESIFQAARFAGVGHTTMRRAVRDGRLVAGRQWFAATRERLRWLIEHPGPFDAAMFEAARISRAA